MNRDLNSDVPVSIRMAKKLVFGFVLTQAPALYRAVFGVPDTNQLQTQHDVPPLRILQIVLEMDVSSTEAARGTTRTNHYDEPPRFRKLRLQQKKKPPTVKVERGFLGVSSRTMSSNILRTLGPFCQEPAGVQRDISLYLAQRNTLEVPGVNCGALSYVDLDMFVSRPPVATVYRSVLLSECPNVVVSRAERVDRRTECLVWPVVFLSNGTLIMSDAFSINTSAALLVPLGAEDLNPASIMAFARKVLAPPARDLSAVADAHVDDLQGLPTATLSQENRNLAERLVSWLRVSRFSLLENTIRQQQQGIVDQLLLLQAGEIERDLLADDDELDESAHPTRIEPDNLGRFIYDKAPTHEQSATAGNRVVTGRPVVLPVRPEDPPVPPPSVMWSPPKGQLDNVVRPNYVRKQLGSSSHFLHTKTLSQPTQSTLHVDEERGFKLKGQAAQPPVRVRAGWTTASLAAFGPVQ